MYISEQGCTGSQQFKDENTVVQLWHAPGASKKFGGSVEIESRDILSKISENTDYNAISKGRRNHKM